jgi:hypothetical protein
MNFDKNKKPGLLQNWMSVFGGIFSAIWFSAVVVLLILDLRAKGGNPYLGVFTYMIAPVFLVGSLLMIPLGAWLERKKRQKHDYIRRFPIIDFNNPRHQKWAYIIWGVSTAFLLLTAVGSYRAYEFTESVTFCGLACHEPMHPEYTAYQQSPHARVACVNCHIGPGVDWFVRSKLSGSYQVYSATFNKYPRPIETPIKNLRPAQEICEQCHWPAKFFGAQQKVFTHYLSDEKNSPWQTQMLIKVGGGDPSLGSTMGIHWHMNIKNKIDYIATDKQRQSIPWVRSTDPDGKVVEYMSTEEPLTPAQVNKSEVRRMDCMDCHNRPSHVFHAPEKSVDEGFMTGHLDTSLPNLKQQAVALLVKSYKTTDEAKNSILAGLSKYYQDNYPEVFQQKSVSIRQATEELIKIYQTNFFPEMKTDWRTHPDNIGHLNSDGCFRCHDGLHKSREGKVLSNDCTICHTFLGQGPPEEINKIPAAAQPFKHPVDVGADVTEGKCTICHTGGGQ